MTAWIRISALTAVAWLCSGCLPEQRVVWSPDGSRAAVLGTDGMYLCDAQGRLSRRLVDGARSVAWLPDGRGVVAATTRKAGTWEAATAGLTAEQLARLEPRVATLRNDLLTCAGDLDHFHSAAFDGLTGAEAGALILLVRDRHAEGLAEKLGPKWDDASRMAVDLWSLQVVDISPDGAATMREVFTSINTIERLRVAPDGRAVAFVSGAVQPEKDSYRLFVASLSRGATPRLVEERSAAFVDWAHQGGWVVYARASAPLPKESNDVRLGAIARREVRAADGALRDEFGACEDLAGILFDQYLTVRCLRDGRILFTAAEVVLPCTRQDMPGGPSLFALDPQRHAAVVRQFPRGAEARMAVTFDVSPDEARVVFAARDKRVAVLTLASGEIQTLLDGDQLRDEMQVLPTWRTADEVCAEAVTGFDGATGKRAEVLLCRGSQRRCISHDWPAEAVGDVLELKPSARPESPAAPSDGT